MSDGALLLLFVLVTLATGVAGYLGQPRRMRLAMGETRLSVALTDMACVGLLLAGMAVGRNAGWSYGRPDAGLILGGVVAILVGVRVRRPLARLFARLVGHAG